MDLLFNVEIYALSCLRYDTKFGRSPLLSRSSKSGIIQRIVAAPPSKCEVNVHRHHCGHEVKRGRVHLLRPALLFGRRQ